MKIYHLALLASLLLPGCASKTERKLESPLLLQSVSLPLSLNWNASVDEVRLALNQRAEWRFQVENRNKHGEVDLLIYEGEYQGEKGVRLITRFSHTGLKSLILEFVKYEGPSWKKWEDLSTAYSSRLGKAHYQEAYNYENKDRDPKYERLKRKVMSLPQSDPYRKTWEKTANLTKKIYFMRLDTKIKQAEWVPKTFWKSERNESILIGVLVRKNKVVNQRKLSPYVYFSIGTPNSLTHN